MRAISDMSSIGRPEAEIAILVYPDCQLSAVHGLADLVRIANDAAREAAGAADAPFLRVSHWHVTEQAFGVACRWDSYSGQAHRISHVIVPPSIVMPERIQPMRQLADWMRARHAEGAKLCSVCAGAFVLAETGLTNGRQITTHWAFARQLAARFPAVTVAEARMVIDDGDIVTAGGILAWVDLGLTLVEQVLGPGTMRATARFLLVEPPRQLQSPYAQFRPEFLHGDAAILRVQHHLQDAVASISRVASLADLAGMTERTFLRRFQRATGLRPLDYLQQLRVSKARDALELTNRSVEQIAFDVGYADPAAFRKLFSRIVGRSPAAYRKGFGVAD